MAIGTPTSLGSAVGAATTTTIAVTAAASASVGDFLVVVVGGANAPAATCTVTDSAGNTWGNDITANSDARGLFIRTAQCTSAITSGSSTFTATFSFGVFARHIAVFKVSGIATSSAFDKSSTATGTVVGYDSGTTTTLAQAAELVVGACVSDSNSAETSTPGTGLTELFDNTNGSALNLAVNYKIVSATTGVKGDGTWTNSGGRNWTAAVATYKGASSSTDATVTAVPAAATGAAPAAAVTPIQTVTGVAALAAGSAPAGVGTASAGTDTFGYANGALGTPWLAWANASGPSSLTVSSGKVIRTSASFGDASYPVSIGPDCQVEAILSASMQSSLSFGLGLRLTAHSSSANGYMVEVIDTGSGTVVKLYKGSAFTEIGTASSPVTSSTVDGYRLTVVGTSIKAHLRISGVWTQVRSETDSTYTSGGYLGFWVTDNTLTGVGVDQLTWGAASAGTDATVTAVPALALGSAPVASASVSTGATVTAVVADATGAGVPAAVSGTGSATVTAVPAVAAGVAPPANSILSSVVNAVAVVALGSAPAAVISSAGNATVTAVPATGLGQAPIATLSAGQTVTAVVADATGAGVAGVLSAGASVVGVIALATGAAVRPTISPAPASSGVSGDVAATFAEAGT